jgi:hypothetical protein
MKASTNSKKIQIPAWLKKMGLWGFLFFLLKGIAWLVIGYVVVK